MISLILAVLIFTVEAWGNNDINGNQIQIWIVLNGGNIHNASISDFENDKSVISQYLNENVELIMLPFIKNNLCFSLESLPRKHHIKTIQYILYIDHNEQLSSILSNQCNAVNIISIMEHDNQRIIRVQYTLSTIKTSRRLLATDYTGWIAVSSPGLPRAANSVAMCVYSNSIWLFGGVPWNNQLVRMDVDTETQDISLGRDYGSNALSMNVYGESKYFTQRNNMFYWIDGDSGNILYVYNLMNHQYGNSLTIPNNVGSFGCLASNDDFLFVVGGGVASQTLDRLQIYNILSGTWSDGALMQEVRREHACIVNINSNTLYAIGGQTGYMAGYLDSVEKISINDIPNEEWSFIDKLAYRHYNPMAISYNDVVLIMCGSQNDGSQSWKATQIQVINCATNTILHGGYLNYEVILTSPVLVNQKRIYLLGGIPGEPAGSITNIWQYFDLPITDSPTTDSPTTDSPTTHPPTTNTPTTDLPTTDAPTTDAPTTDAPTTYPPTTYPPTTNPPTTDVPTTSDPTNAPITTTDTVNGIYVNIEFQYEFDSNATKTISEIINNVINEIINNNTIGNNDCISSLIYNTTNTQQNTTMINVRISFCDKEVKTNLIAIFNNNLEKDIIQKINNNNNIQLIASHDLINIIIDGDIINYTSNTTFNDDYMDINKNNDNNKKNNTMIYIILLIMGAILLIIFGVILYIFHRHKHRKKTNIDINNVLQIQTEKKKQTNICRAFSVESGQIEEGETNLTPTTTSKRNDVDIITDNGDV